MGYHVKGLSLMKSRGSEDPRIMMKDTLLIITRGIGL